MPVQVRDSLSRSTAVGPGDPPEIGQRQYSKTAAREILTINATKNKVM